LQGIDGPEESGGSLLPSDSDSARIRAFELVRDVQAADPGADSEIARLLARAEHEGWPDVVRGCLYARAVSAWFAGADGLSEIIEALLLRSVDDGDNVMVALALAMRAARGTTGDDPAAAAAADADLARAAVLVEEGEGGTLERISAHTALGVAFGDRGLWELGDEQHAAVFTIAKSKAPGTLDYVLAAVVYNRAEVQVSWACRLRQLGDSAGVAERLQIWEEVSAATSSFSVPEAWRTELAALGVLLAAIAGEDRAEQARTMIAELSEETFQGPSPLGLLTLAVALSEATTARAGAADTAEAAIALIHPTDHPHEYELALHVAAELEARAGHGAGLRYARRQFAERWTTRLAALGSMQSRIQAERLSADYDILSQHAHLDDLTGAGNRRALERYMSNLGHRGIETIALVMVDVDDFKEVNDRYGHAAGDAALVKVASLLAESVRPSDIVVRLGGDEFAIVLADADLEVGRRRAETVMARIDRQGTQEAPIGPNITVSMGVTAGNPDRIQELSASADAALYEAKAGGGHRIVYRQAV
jgi:diguanylate cyclase (GGDEF)-like protein